jgi:ketosteroid isomerase-like protein
MAGRDAIIKFYASYMKAGDKQTDTFTSSRLIGDVALCTGRFTFAPASGDAASKGNWTKVAGKVGGEWKILNLTYNFAAPE